MNRPYKLCLATLFVGIVFTILFSLQIPYLFSKLLLSDVIASILFFDRLYIDLLILLLITLPLVNRSAIFRIASYIVISIIITSLAIQFSSVYISGEFVSLLAVDNINHINLLFNWTSTALIFSIALSIIILIGFVEVGSCEIIKTRHLSSLIFIVFGITLLLVTQEKWIASAITNQRDKVYEQRDVRVVHKSPTEALFKTVFRKRPAALRRFTASDSIRAKSYGFSIKSGERYPLLKDRFYDAEIPFPRKRNAIEKPNIIVFFVEGLSARIINPYSDLYPKLTPNFDQFSKVAMRVDNYYNHTYATYRGLLGQLCSTFPSRGGQGGWQTNFEDIKSVHYSCLTQLLNGNGYQTIFLDSHLKDAAYIDEMMNLLGFNQVITAENIIRDHIREKPLRSDSLSDNQLIRGLISLLKNAETTTTNESFFLGIYNLETHVWQSIAKDGKEYPLQQNLVLDTIHNFDSAFGKFWQYFENSPFFDNTIVVLTADHAHYPGRDFVRLLKEDKAYQGYFVDQIPLMIYDPTKELPESYDARYGSSIDFAPTIAHYLDFENEANAFLGKSIFDASVNRSIAGTAAAGDDIYLITSQKIEKNKQNTEHSSELEYFSYLINKIQQLENHDRIFPKEN